jgi:lysozyme family protein
MAEFIIAYQKTEVFEGNYSNDPNDQGGETYKGISRKFHPDWSGWSILDLMDDKNTKNSQLQSLVNSFYHNEFWEFLKCEKFDQTIADELFDTAVNQGKITAAKYLQESLNLLNNNQRHYKDILIDGAIGNKTITAYNEFMNTSAFSGRSKEKNINTLLKVLNGLQFERYKDIVKRSPDQEIYFYGWLQRVKKNEKNTDISKKENLEPFEREKERYRNITLAGRNGNGSIYAENLKPIPDRIYSNRGNGNDGSWRNSLISKNKNSTETIALQNKTEQSINSLIKLRLRLKIRLHDIKQFFLTLKKQNNGTVR